MNAIECKNVLKRYGGFSLSLPSFSVEEGTIMGLVGANGAGKSTVIRLLMKLCRPECGTIEILGKDNQYEFNNVKQNIGIVLEEPGIPDSISTHQVGSIMQQVYKKWNPLIFTDLLNTLSLPSDKPFKEFSRGMKMKLSLAIALSHDARLLILDEPTIGLDPLARDEMLDLFLDFTRTENHTILFSSHITSDLEKICDQITYLETGKVLFSENTETLSEAYAKVVCKKSQLEDIAQASILGIRETPYCYEVLMRTPEVPTFLQKQKVSLEELIILMAKKGRGVA